MDIEKKVEARYGPTMVCSYCSREIEEWMKLTDENKERFICSTCLIKAFDSILVWRTGGNF